MTAKERNLWMIVGAVIVGTLIIKLLTGGLKPVETANSPEKMDVQSSYKLLKSQHKIESRNQAVRQYLERLDNKFFDPPTPNRRRSTCWRRLKIWLQIPD